MSTTLSRTEQIPTNFLRLMAERVDAERGRRIERLMDLQGWKPTPLARVMRVDRTQVYNWKAGRAISSDSLERLAVALETTRLYIETGEGEPHYPRGAPPELLLRQLAAAADEFRGAGEPDPEGD